MGDYPPTPYRVAHAVTDPNLLFLLDRHAEESGRVVPFLVKRSVQSLDNACGWYGRIQRVLDAEVCEQSRSVSGLADCHHTRSRNVMR